MWTFFILGNFMKRFPISYFKLLLVVNNLLHKTERAFTYGQIVSHDLQIVFICCESSTYAVH
jgi:hypothetical protein